MLEGDPALPSAPSVNPFAAAVPAFPVEAAARSARIKDDAPLNPTDAMNRTPVFGIDVLETKLAPSDVV